MASPSTSLVTDIANEGCVESPAVTAREVGAMDTTGAPGVAMVMAAVPGAGVRLEVAVSVIFVMAVTLAGGV